MQLSLRLLVQPTAQVMGQPHSTYQTPQQFICEGLVRKPLAALHTLKLSAPFRAINSRAIQ
jgi:hypothetical protein